MRVLMAIYGLGAGGAERAFSELAASFVAAGWDVAVATFATDGNSDFYALPGQVRRHRLGVQARGIAASLTGNAARVRALRNVIRTERPDLVLGFMETINVLCLLAAAGLGVPVVVAERIDPSMHRAVPGAWRVARRLLYRHAAAVVAQTENAAQWLRRRCGTPVVVIPNAVRALPRPRSPREPLVLAVGRLERQKGFDVLLDAFARLPDRHRGWRLAIVGEGTQREALHAQAARLGLADRVEWHGRTRDVESWYARASIVAAPSRFEGFPNVLLEAMAMGAAVVAADCRSGPRELVVPEHNGLLVPVDDAAALAAALARLIGDAALRQRLGAAALAVRDDFGAVAILPRWHALLARAAARRARRVAS